ncbi:unnamed protein product [Orchesella dallaii]|uniref:Uncharacterized protein n=1 Tax=Orchesella dallaii TaxID=48710 RepID=A0ABP1S9H0_9HEXA
MLKTGVPHQISRLMMLVWILLTLHCQWLTSAENASPTKVSFSRDNVSTFFVPPLEPKFRYKKHNLEGMIKLVSQRFGTILTHNVPALPKLSSYENITNNVVVVPLVVAEHNKRSKIEEQMRVKVSFDMSPSTTYKFRARNIPYNRSFSVAKHYADEANKIHPGTVDTLVLHHEDYLHFVMRDYQGDTEITKKLEFIKDVLNNTENTKYKLGVMISRAFFEDTNKTPLTELLKYVDEVYPTIYARQDLDAEPEAVPDHTLQLQSFKSCNQTIKGINPDVKIIPILMCSPSKSTTGVVTTSDFFNVGSQ